MASVNRTTVVGRLGSDVEVKKSQAGNSYTYFSVATDDVTGKNKTDGKWETETTWHDCKVFGHLADYLGQYAKKGSTVYVEGRAEHKRDKDKEGVTYHNIIVSQAIVMGAKNGTSTPAAKESDVAAQADRAAQRAGTTVAEPSPAPSQEVAGTPNVVTVDDDLPF